MFNFVSVALLPFFVKLNLGYFVYVFTFIEKVKTESSTTAELKKQQSLIDLKKEIYQSGSDHIAAQTFTFRELASATRNFREDFLLGEGGFGRVYKGRLENINQVCYLILLSSRFSFCTPFLLGIIVGINFST